MSDQQPVKIDGCTVDENKFVCGNKVWLVTNLIEKSKDLTPFDLPLAAIYSGSNVWDMTGSAYGIAKHVRRALDVDTSYPVIMDEEGFIMDGWHRVLRALMDKATTIKAVRFEKTPECDFTKPSDS